ncbi:MAG: hypothetical protein ACI8QS_000677 [Planctomycetota bacterium]|jgi:hypothetical protein
MIYQSTLSSTLSSTLGATLRAAVLLLLPATALAQAGGLDSPGKPLYGRLGQATRFSPEFNPAFGVVIDTYVDFSDNDEADGFDADLRLMELNAASHVDPNAWAYIVLSSESAESPTVEEAALVYTGFEGNSTLKAGRFFVDFGKQMQWHPEALRTLERALVLREFLGEELAGTGAQFGHWLPVGDTSVVRFSVGAFASLLSEQEDEEAPESSVAERRNFDEFSFTARLTGMTDVGDNGQMQLGVSARVVPEFTFEAAGLRREGLSNSVYGLDFTYGHADDTGLSSTVVGAEYLVFDGDLSAALDDQDNPTSLEIVDDAVTGALLYADYGWNGRDSAGVQYSFLEEPENPDSDVSEIDFYFTRNLTEFRRARLGVTFADSDSTGDEVRVYLQFTAFFGSHAHGADW